MEKRWVVKTPADPSVTSSLAKELKVSALLASLLVNRGISTYEDAKSFFRPELSMLHDPFLMKDMDKAVERIETALGDGEKIMIYGDYDVDGTTAVSLVYSFFIEVYPQIEYYIPDRYKEGYGVSTQGIDYAHKKGFTLIICLDCGIKAVDKIQYAKDKGIDFIVCDHHLPGDQLPPAYAVLDPKRSDCTYPYDELSGCGIGFKLVQAFASKNDIPFTELEQYFDLAAVSIASDIVPITGENRVLAHFGLKVLNNNPRPGFKAMLELINVKKEMKVSNLVFIIGPRINAAGRIETGKNAVSLLISKDIESAMTKSEHINRNNTERRDIDVDITKQALNMIDNDPKMANNKTTVLYDPNWHKGVIGIVASRLIEKHYRPTIVLTESNGKATGSARSVKDFNVYNAIDACSGLLDQFGGHKYAAGLTMAVENIELFKKEFEKVVNDTIDENLLTPRIEIDAEIGLGDITSKFYRILNQFEPYGPMNMTPVFKTMGIRDTGYARIVGENHLKLTVESTEGGKTYSAIAFNQSEALEMLKQPVDICYTIEENEWNGEVSLQLNIKDIKPSAN